MIKLSHAKKCIIKALVKLMKDERYEDITITQIMQEADLARRTFYLNYSDKKDVLFDYIAQIFQEYIERLPKDARSIQTDTVLYFEIWSEHKDFLAALYQNGIFFYLLEPFEKLLSSSKMFEYMHRSTAEKDYTVILAVAMIWRLQLEWVKTGMRETAEELSKVIIDQIPALAQQPQI